ncbi:MAG: EAL domain-containing protein [Pseudomonadota bacterium]
MARLIVEHVRDGIVLTDANGFIEWVNPAFTRMSGYELQELVGRRPASVLQGPGTTRESKAVLRRAIDARSPCETDIVNYSKSGEPYISQIRLSPVIAEDGELIYFVAIQRDVTKERHLAQDSVDFQAYQRALEMQAIVSIADTRGQITYVNKKFCEISGFENGELLGKTHRLINSGYHDREFFKDMWNTISAGGTWHGEVCNRTKSGDLYWVDTTIVPVRASDGSIERYVSTRYDVTDRKIAETSLKRQAETDALTGVGNRARFLSDLKTICLSRRGDEVDTYLLVLMIDLDHFKDLNDRLGHHTGDLLLREIAHRLQKSIGEDGSVSRMGGDEFAALVELRKDVDPKHFTSAFHEAVSEATSLDGVVYFPSISIGVAQHPEDAETAEGLLLNADMALYDAKRAGRRTWNFFDPKTRVHVDHRNRIRGMVEQAIDEESFEIALQPVCRIRTRGHEGFEVLARLTHEGENVPADQFIPIAEQYGLIPKVGEVIFEKAMAAHNDMRKAGLSPGVLGLNLAAPQFRVPGFVENLQDALMHNALSPEDLVVEITETALIGRSTSVVADALTRLQNSGVSIALDDFGTGFSSLSHLRDFPVDKIKIDKSFVANIEHAIEDRNLVKGLIELARNLGLDVIAEGVETELQAQIIEELGCELMQGYVHSRPVTVENARQFLLANQPFAPTAKATA